MERKSWKLEAGSLEVGCGGKAAVMHIDVYLIERAPEQIAARDAGIARDKSKLHPSTNSKSPYLRHGTMR